MRQNTVKMKIFLVTCFLLFACRVFPEDSLSFIENGQELGNSGCCATGDLDADGDFDMVVIHWSAPGIIYLNDGQGHFMAAGQNLNIQGARDVKVVDLDQDDNLDLFVCTGTGNRVFLNDGSAQFIDSGQRLGDRPSMEAELGDIDSDGDSDAVIANFHTQSGSASRNTIWLNDGSGLFVESSHTLGSTVADNLELGDLNGDGFLDVLMGNVRDPGVKVWLNNGEGVFTMSAQNFGNGGILTACDLDGDKDMDFFRGQKASNEVWLNAGDGTFVQTPQTLENVHNSGAWNAAVCDIDGDSDLDIVTALGDGRGLPIIEETPNMIWLNDGAGRFTDSGLRLGAGNSEALATGDFNGDHRMDLYFSNTSRTLDKVWLQQSGGSTSIKKSMTKPSTSFLFDNFPNPFNGSTTIRYALAKPSRVRVAVYDVLGQSICMLHNGMKHAGEHALIWNGRDGSDHPVGSGLYYYRLESDKHQITKKMFLCR